MIEPEQLFQMLSDETRLRCLLLLLKEKELCVCELNHILGIIQPKISRHLALLRMSGLVLDERRGQWIYYRLNPKLQKWAQAILRAAFKELKDSEPHFSDFKKISAARKTNLSCC